MNNLFSKTIIAACILAGSAGLANAAGPGPATTRTADLVFSAPSAVTLTITPSDKLDAGVVPNKTELASVEVTAQNGKAFEYAVKYTDGTAVIADPAKPYNATLSGKNAPDDNKLNVGFWGLGGKAQTDGWYTTGPSESSKFTVVAIGEQEVNADAYTISIDAAEWQS